MCIRDSSKNLAKLWWEQISVPAAARQLQADLLWVPYWAAPWWQPVPTAVTVHDVIQLILPAYRGGLLNRLYTRLVAATARKSASIIAVSHASKRDIVQLLGVPESRVHVVHHGPKDVYKRQVRRAVWLRDHLNRVQTAVSYTHLMGQQMTIAIISTLPKPFQLKLALR